MLTMPKGLVGALKLCENHFMLISQYFVGKGVLFLFHRQNTSSERISGPECIMNIRKAGSRTRALFPKSLILHCIQ